MTVPLRENNKHLFIILKRFLIAKNCLGPESVSWMFLQQWLRILQHCNTSFRRFKQITGTLILVRHSGLQYLREKYNSFTGLFSPAIDFIFVKGVSVDTQSKWSLQKMLIWRLRHHINTVQPSVAFHIEIIQLICCADQMTGFCMKRSTGLKWANTLCRFNLGTFPLEYHDAIKICLRNFGTIFNIFFFQKYRIDSLIEISQISFDSNFKKMSIAGGTVT